MRIDEQQKLFKKYLDNTATREEVELVERWYKDFDQLEIESEEITPFIRQSMESAILKRIKNQKIRTKWVTLSGIAAMLAIFMFFIWNYPGHKEKKYTFLNSRDKQLKVFLPDSSVLWLNNQTSVKYIQDEYGLDKRELWLDKGEAYFEVVPDKKVPFIVHTESLQTKVLGTAFNIKKSDIHKTKEVQITVAHGKVQVNNSGKFSNILTRGNQLEYKITSDTYQLTNIRPSHALAWQNEKIYLENANLQDLSAAFYSLYDQKLITSSKSIKNFKFNITLSKNLTAEESLAIITAIHQIKYKKENGKIHLYK